MTKSTPGMSNPLAATSVATNNGISPDLNCSTAFVRPSWLLSPWILVTFHPVRLKLFSIRSASFLYSTNMRIRFFLSLWYFLRSCCSLCSLALSSKTSTIWVILVPAARSSLPMVTLMKGWKIDQNYQKLCNPKLMDRITELSQILGKPNDMINYKEWQIQGKVSYLCF